MGKCRVRTEPGGRAYMERSPKYCQGKKKSWLPWRPGEEATSREVGGGHQELREPKGPKEPPAWVVEGSSKCDLQTPCCQAAHCTSAQ